MAADMSSQAITRRLKAASDLRALCLQLGQSSTMVVKEDTAEYNFKKKEH